MSTDKMNKDEKKFRDMTPEERLNILKKERDLTEEECSFLMNTGTLDMEKATGMIENVVGTSELPLGIATYFKIDNEEYYIPMTLEEPSVVAAASYAAKLALPDGFKTKVDKPEMIGQIQLTNIPDIEKTKHIIEENKQKIIDICNEKDKILVKFGGGCQDIYVEELDTDKGKMLIVNLVVDVRDAMGANAVNTMAEAVGNFLVKETGATLCLRIISNLATKRIAHAECVWKKDVIGEATVEGVLTAYEFAKNNFHRCSTHNKGIMNGIDAVTIATGNDWRAVEAGAHAYAAYDANAEGGYGKYKPLTKYTKTKEGDLKGEIELPLALGTIGGAIKTNKIAQVSLKILGNPSAQKLAGIIATVGLAQNFAALRAMSTEGIQRGHMRLHAKNIAINAGATGEDIEKISKQMLEEFNISVDRAKELLKK